MFKKYKYVFVNHDETTNYYYNEVRGKDYRLHLKKGQKGLMKLNLFQALDDKSKMPIIRKRQVMVEILRSESKYYIVDIIRGDNVQ